MKAVYKIKMLRNIFFDSRNAARMLDINVLNRSFNLDLDGEIAKDRFVLSRKGSVYLGLNNSVMNEPYAYAFSEPVDFNFGKKFNELVSTNQKQISEMEKNSENNEIHVHYVNYHPDGDQIWIPRDMNYKGIIAVVDATTNPTARTLIPYFIPKGFWVKVKRNIWHCPPFLVTDKGINSFSSSVLNIQAKSHECVGKNLLLEDGYGLKVKFPTDMKFPDNHRCPI